MSESQHDSLRGWVDASEVPFTELGVVRYTIGPHWLEIECNPDGSYIVDSDLLDEETGFRDGDALLAWVEEHGLVEVLSHAGRG